jgi:hypothetical protein
MQIRKIPVRQILAVGAVLALFTPWYEYSDGVQAFGIVVAFAAMVSPQFTLWRLALLAMIGGGLLGALMSLDRPIFAQRWLRWHPWLWLSAAMGTLLWSLAALPATRWGAWTATMLFTLNFVYTLVEHIVAKPEATIDDD